MKAEDITTMILIKAAPILQLGIIVNDVPKNMALKIQANVDNFWDNIKVQLLSDLPVKTDLLLIVQREDTCVDEDDLRMHVHKQCLDAYFVATVFHVLRPTIWLPFSTPCFCRSLKKSNCRGGSFQQKKLNYLHRASAKYEPHSEKLLVQLTIAAGEPED